MQATASSPSKSPFHAVVTSANSGHIDETKASFQDNAKKKKGLDYLETVVRAVFVAIICKVQTRQVSKSPLHLGINKDTNAWIPPNYLLALS